MKKLNSYTSQPDKDGHFGVHGGRYVPETLMPLVLQVEAAYDKAKADPAFQAELDYYLKHYVGRPSPLFFAERLTSHLGGAKIYLKREELNHTGAHKINHCMGQILLAKRMGKTRIIAETGAGQHGVATATVAALFNLPCTIYMGELDIERQKPNVFRMRLLGAEVKAVTSGSRSLKDAMNGALRDWVANVEDTFYIIGTVGGPHPYPAMVRDFQAIIGRETRTQLWGAEKRLPDSLVACVGGGSNAIGLFYEFLNDASVAMYAVEAAGLGLNTDKHAAALEGGKQGILHGMRSYFLQDEDGQIQEAHSISAGLDYPGVGPEHAWLFDERRVNYVPATDDEAVEAFKLLSRLEGILPALEPSHALAYVTKLAPTLPKDHLMVVNLSGRGDKDIFTIANKNRGDIVSRIATRFAKLKRANKKAFITFTTAGDPDLETFAEILGKQAGAGVDLIEIGMPFSDPVADGPVIERANSRAFAAGIRMKKILDCVAKFREKDNDTPIILMGYANPIYAHGLGLFVALAKEAGVDGLIVADLPPEEDSDLRAAAQKQDIDIIRLLTPTTDEKRLPTVLDGAGGFLYYVSVAGITGSKQAVTEQVQNAIGKIRPHTKLPLAVGFGISTPEQAADIAKIADAVIVGSAIVGRIADNLDAEGKAKPDLVKNVLAFIETLAQAVHKV